MGAISTRSITCEEFEKLDLPPHRKWELHKGEIVEMPFPSLIHKRLQQRVCDLFRQAFSAAEVLEEYPYRIESTHDDRSADIGAASRERSDSNPEQTPLIGPPELVAEVLSPSNSATELKQLRRLCFANGTKLFLILDPDDNTIEIYLEADKASSVLRPGDSLAINLFGAQASIPVAAVFEGITFAKA